MDAPQSAVVTIAMRWLHIASVVTLLGSCFYQRFVMNPVAKSLDDEARADLLGKAAASLRPWLFIAMASVVGSGAYNLLTKAGASRSYYIWFGIKMIFVLHILGVAPLLVSPARREEKRSRLTAGVVVSGMVVLAISAYLRWLSMH